MMPRSTFAFAVLLAWAAATGAQEQAAPGEKAPGGEKPPILALEEITITPSAPAADTLCQLRVRLSNAGDRVATSLGFQVRIGEDDLKVYDNQLFMDPLPPGKTTEVRLFNFWTSESLRPPPKDGKLKLQVTLREAQWVAITTEDDGTEVWTLGDAVGGLPVAREMTVPLAKK